MPDMKDYVLYHANLDIQKDCTKMKLVDTACTDQSDKPYLVEKEVKRFSNDRNQYEYWIKWQGHTFSENTTRKHSCQHVSWI